MVTELMNRELTVRCANCAVQMSVKAAQTRVVITCPICAHKTTLDWSNGQYVCGALRDDDFSRLPDPIVVQKPVAGPARSERTLRRAARLAYMKENRDSIQAARIEMLKMVAVALVCLGITVAIVTLSYQKLNKVPAHYWAEVIPGMESPDKLLKQYAGICANCTATCNSIDDASSRDQAAPKIRAMAAILSEFPQRVENMAQLAATQIQSLDPSFRETVELGQKQARESVERVQSKKSAYSAELFQALIKFLQANDAAAEAILSKWTPSTNSASSDDELLASERN